MLSQVVDLFIERQDGFDCGRALRSHGQTQDAGMIESTSDSAPDVIGQPLRGADALHEARGKPAAKGFIEDSNRIVVGIVPPNTEPHHVDGTLVDVFFLDLVVTRLGRLEVDLFFFRRWPLWPCAERLAKFGLHRAASKSPTIPKMMLLG